MGVRGQDRCAGVVGGSGELGCAGWAGGRDE